MSTETLGHLIEQVGGSIKTGPFGTTLKADEYSETGVPIISVGEVGYGSLSLRGDTPRAPIEVTKRLPEYLLETGDIVFGRKGAVDRSAWVKESENGWFLGSDGIRVRLPSSVDSRFVAYQFQSDATKNWLLQHASGSTMLSLNQRILARVPLVLPTLPEQHAIAKVLGALDDKITANTELAAMASEVALLTASRFAPSVPLGEIAIHRKKSISPQALQVPKVSHFSLPAFDAGELPELSSPHDIKSSKFLIESPSVLISKLNPRFPRVWNVAEVPPVPALSSTEFLVLESPFTTTAVLWSLLRQEAFGAELESKVAGTSGSHQRVKPADLLATHIADPRAIGESAAEQITALGAVSAKCRVENQTLAETRDALLPQLMSGKLRIRDAEKVLENAGV